MSIYRRYGNMGVSGWAAFFALVVELTLWVVFWMAVALLALTAWLAGGAIYGVSRTVVAVSGGTRGTTWMQVGRQVAALPLRAASARTSSQRR